MISEEEKQEVLKELRELQSCGDIEAAHSKADDILCKVLQDLGYGDLVEGYLAVPKWYA